MRPLLLFSVLFAILFITGCDNEDTERLCFSQNDENCYYNEKEACPEYYDPVCGDNNITYSNSCEADRDNVDYRYGACEIQCPPVYCDLNCVNGYQQDHDGCMLCRCIEVVCDCPGIVEPVCGSNGQTYSNSCEAECSGIAVDYVGSCETTITGCQGHDDCDPKQQCIVTIESCQCDTSGCYCPEGGHCVALKEGCYKDNDCPGSQACILPESCSCDESGCYCSEPGRCIPRAPEVCILDEECPENFTCQYVDDCYLNDEGVVDCNGFGYCTPNSDPTIEGGSK